MTFFVPAADRPVTQGLLRGYFCLGEFTCKRLNSSNNTLIVFLHLQADHDGGRQFLKQLDATNTEGLREVIDRAKSMHIILFKAYIASIKNIVYKAI